jgi:non-ribosomal peptide synthetase-like protein
MGAVPLSSLVLTAPGDNAIRCPAGTRFEAQFAGLLQRMGADAESRVAVEADGLSTSYSDLGRLAHRLARHLLVRGVGAGDRVGILLKGTPETYASMLAVLAVGAVFVPLDAVFPPDRIAYILSDSGARFALCDTSSEHLLPREGCTIIAVDREAAAIAAQSSEPLPPPQASDDLCYIIYTSGTTGRPKGVQIEHRQFCNFVAVAREVYGVPAGARMYQGLTIAFDFAVEEIWVPLFSGATLVPAPLTGGNLAGEDLAEFLKAQRVTALCAVPTLLASFEEELPDLVFLLVSGEACPADLVKRWWRPGRMFLNAYGPTEATVTATLGTPEPGRAVTIGRPLPTYMVLIRDPESGEFLPHGETGEIILAGVGLSRGYLNRDDLTAKAFIADPLRLPDNPGGTLYRTGDLGRVTPEGEVEYLGRIDSQVKIRGYRIELTEIESILMQTPGIAQAVVDKVEPEPGRVELAAWYAPAAPSHGVERVTPQAVHARLKEYLPGFMVPAFLTEVASIPMLPSGKADRKSLPPPALRLATPSATHTAPASDSEALLADVVAEIGKVDNPSVTDDFFDALGLNSLLIARIAAAVRKRRPGVSVSMKDFYLRRSIRDVAPLLDTPVEPAVPAMVSSPAPHIAGTIAYWGTGAAQLVVTFLYAWLFADIGLRGLHWVEASGDVAVLYLRASATGAALFALSVALPIAAKWLLIGRFTPERFPVWSVAYFRFWLVKALIRANPLALFAGTPLYNVYLRLLGARIGRDALILGGSIPSCPDLLEIGDRAIVARSAHLALNAAEAGWMESGPIRIGAGAYIGETAVVERNTSIGDGAALAHASSLHSGQSIPAGQSWHGSPAQAAPHDYRADTREPPSRWRKAGSMLFQLVVLFGITLPMPFVIVVGLDWFGEGNATDVVATAEAAVPANSADLDLAYLFDGAALNLMLLYASSFVVALFTATAAPRVLGFFLNPGASYPLYGLRYTGLRWVLWLGNPRELNLLLGDSAVIVYLLRMMGVGVSTATNDQTGSNFGLTQHFDVPAFCALGPGTMASDGLGMQNLIYGSATVRVEPATVGARSFLGNSLLIPPGGRLGDDCLLATKAMVPMHGPVREGVGLLGSPAFEIPRTVARDRVFPEFQDPAAKARALRWKLASNSATMAAYLLSRFVLFCLFWAMLMLVFRLYPVVGSVVAPAASLALLLVSLAAFILLEHLATAFQGLRPKFCSIYDPSYWRHERYWKLTTIASTVALAGTPFLPVFWRLAGVRIGARVFDDGCGITERSLTTVGDHATLNAGSVVQGHSLEDGVFKSGRIVVGNGVTLSTKAFVHYDTIIGDGATLAADSFLMKGEVVGASEAWGGNPARWVSR